MSENGKGNVIFRFLLWHLGYGGAAQHDKEHRTVFCRSLTLRRRETGEEVKLNSRSKEDF